ncbi:MULTISPECIES: hypothetical protein [unclassified Mameliella]|uniref:hypothetical protein n=1 Tax=unclassified Mameliella TaxID=2630630 RepID=UPI00273EB54A|nr:MULTISPECIES: hypothetical protein [unclassified Mameliella]
MMRGFLRAFFGLSMGAQSEASSGDSRPDTGNAGTDSVKKAADLLLCPVIFANGEDDDSYGYAAWVRQDGPVMFDDRVFHPGEQMVIEGRKMLFQRGVRMVDRETGELMTQLGGGFDALTVPVKTGTPDSQEDVFLIVRHCNLDMANGIAWTNPKMM